MFGNPQDIIAILAGAALIFGAGGAAVRNAVNKPREPSDAASGATDDGDS